MQIVARVGAPRVKRYMGVPATKNGRILPSETLKSPPYTLFGVPPGA